MPDDASVSGWLDGLRAGDEADIQRLWDRYFQQLVRLAGKKLPGHARREFDEEDVALSAFHSFCDRVGRGQFPQLADRDDLWRLLVTITARKAVSSVRHQTAQKRGGGRVLGESAFLETGDDEAASDGLAGFLSREPTPELAAQFAEDYDRLFDRLQNPSLKTIALRRLEGQAPRRSPASWGPRPDGRPQAPADPCPLGRRDSGMTPRASTGDEDLPVADLLDIDAACDRFEAAWRDGQSRSCRHSSPTLRRLPSPGSSASC